MKRTPVKEAILSFDAKSENEALSRIFVTGFVLPLNLSTEELADLKTVVSEAVTNCIVHAYRENPQGKIRLTLKYYSDGLLRITVLDRGCGIEDVEEALKPFFTTDREHERCGMGFAIMETFMNRLRVTSAPGRGTRVTMEKRLHAA